MNYPGVSSFSVDLPRDYLDGLFGSCNTTKITLFEQDESLDEDEKPGDFFENLMVFYEVLRFVRIYFSRM